MSRARTKNRRLPAQANKGKNRRLFLESLEDRLALAGNVLLSLDTNTLNLVSVLPNENDTVIIAKTATGYTVDGGVTATLIPGVIVPFGADGIEVIHAVDSIQIDLKSGLDAIAVTSADDPIAGEGGNSGTLTINGINVTGQDMSLASTGDLAIAGAVDLGAGDLTLNVTGNVTQTAAIKATGLQLLGSGTVKLENPSNDVTNLAANYTGTISYTDTNDLNVATVTDTASTAAPSTNQLKSNADVKLTTANAGGNLAINNSVDLGAGDLTLEVTGNVTQTAAIKATGLRLLGSGTVKLENTGNDVTNLAADYSGTISYTDANVLNVAQVSDSASTFPTSTNQFKSNADAKLTTVNAGGNLSINAPVDLGAGDLTLDVTGNVTQTATIKAAGLQLLGTGSVKLENTGNDVANVAANYSGTVSYTDTNALNVNTVTDSASSGAPSTNQLKSNADVKLTTVNAAGNLAIGVAVDLGAGDLTLEVNGNVSQSATIKATGLQLLGTGTVKLENISNDVTNLAANYSGTISYTDTNALNVATVSDSASTAASSTNQLKTNADVKLTKVNAVGELALNVPLDLGAGNLTLDAVGSVTQTAAIKAAGLQLLGSGPIKLENTGNDVTNVASNHLGTISYTDTNSLNVAQVSDSASTAAPSNNQLKNNEDVKLTTVNSGGNLAINAPIDLGAGDLTLDVTGNVTQTATIKAAGLQLLGTGTVTLENTGNAITNVAANYSGTISYTDTNALNVAAVSDTASVAAPSTAQLKSNADVKLKTVNAASNLAINVPVDLGTGDLTLDVNGDVTQTAAIKATGLQLLGMGAITLNNIGNDVATIAANHSGSISYKDATVLTIGTVTDTASTPNTSTSGMIAAGGTLTVESGAAAIADQGRLTIDGNVSAGLTVTMTADETLGSPRQDNLILKSGRTVVSFTDSVILQAGDDLVVEVTSIIDASVNGSVQLNSVDDDVNVETLPNGSGLDPTTGSVINVLGNITAKNDIKITTRGDADTINVKAKGLSATKLDINGAGNDASRTDRVRTGQNATPPPALPAKALRPSFIPAIQENVDLSDQLTMDYTELPFIGGNTNANTVVKYNLAPGVLTVDAMAAATLTPVTFDAIEQLSLKVNPGAVDVIANLTDPVPGQPVKLPAIVQVFASGKNDRLQVIGTTGADNVSIGDVSHDLPLARAQFELSGVQRMWVQTLGNNDSIDNISHVPALIDGGLGNDVIHNLVNDPNSKLQLLKKISQIQPVEVSLVLGNEGSDQLFTGTGLVDKTKPANPINAALQGFGDSGITVLFGDHKVTPLGGNNYKFDPVANIAAAKDSYFSSAAQLRHGFITKGNDRPGEGIFAFGAGDQVKFSNTISWLKAQIFVGKVVNDLLGVLAKQIGFYENPVTASVGEAPSETLADSDATSFSATVDVNRDGEITPLDALLVINELNSRGSYKSPAPALAEGEAEDETFDSTPNFDVDGDEEVSAIDALMVVNALNTMSEWDAEGSDADEAPLDEASASEDNAAATTPSYATSHDLIMLLLSSNSQSSSGRRNI